MIYRCPTLEPRGGGRLDAVWWATPVLLLSYLGVVCLTSPDAWRLAPAVTLFNGLLAAGLALALLALGGTWVAGLRAQHAESLLRPSTTFGFALFPALAGGLGSWPGAAAALAGWGQALFLVALTLLLIAAVWHVGAGERQQRLLGVAEQRTGRPSWRDFYALTKMGLNALVLVTTSIGFYLASRGGIDGWLFLWALSGTALVAAGSSVLNQFIERDVDALMERTANRPLPAGRLRPFEALLFGTGLSLVGLLILIWRVNLLTAFLGGLTLAVYLFLYTPMKRTSTLSTLAGAISGAVPPVMGWTATGEPIGPLAVVLFLILFFWQEPHFLAIGWKYRKQYGAAGFPLYSVLDSRGKATAAQAVWYAAALLATTLAPLALGTGGAVYGTAAALAGIGFAALAIRFWFRPARGSAMALFFGSIAYLPLTLLLVLFLGGAQG